MWRLVEAGRLTRMLRLCDRIAAGCVIAAVLYIAVRTLPHGMFDVLQPRGPLAISMLVIGGLIATGLLTIPTWSKRRVRLAGRAFLYGATLLVAAMALARVMADIREARLPAHWPPRIELLRAVKLDSLSPSLRAAWGSAVAAHLVADRRGTVAPVAIPSEWPFPTDVEIAVDTGHDGRTHVWARTSDGVVSCVPLGASVIAGGDPHTGCAGRDGQPADLLFIRPSRGSASGFLGAPQVVGAAWPQYRRDAGKTGLAPPPFGSPRPWQTDVGGQIRASASVVGDFVLVGAHGSGLLTALDATTGVVRWTARVPNWIHQDPVSDGRVVVVGFGDNKGSFMGTTPSGVAAYDLATGSRLWTAFDDGSVMTSPIIRDSVIVYGTGAALLYKRMLMTGRLLAVRELPGMVTMAPPASIGDTIVFSLDHDWVCAFRISTLDTSWCRQVMHLFMMGHAGPAIVGDQVIVSGSATVLSLTWNEFTRFGPMSQWRLIRSVLFASGYPEHPGQIFASLALRDGAVQWKRALFGRTRIVDGHTSGTAAISGDAGVIVLPLLDQVVGFDVSSGRVRWVAGAHGARGPASIVDGRAVVAGRDGVIEVRDVDRGSLACTIRRKVGWDRAGPTLAGNMLIFADLNGGVEAMPKDAVLGCVGSGEPDA